MAGTEMETVLAGTQSNEIDLEFDKSYLLTDGLSLHDNNDCDILTLKSEDGDPVLAMHFHSKNWTAKSETFVSYMEETKMFNQIMATFRKDALKLHDREVTMDRLDRIEVNFRAVVHELKDAEKRPESAKSNKRPIDDLWYMLARLEHS
jgi:hypothetical protein